MLKCDKSNDFKGALFRRIKLQKVEIKWQNAVPSQNPHNVADNIRLINYQK